MKTTKHSLNTKEMELVKQLIANCENTGDVQAMLKRLFAGTIEQMLEAEMEEHLGYEKNSVAGNNSGNSRNGYGKKTIISDFGECEIAVPRDRNGEFEPRVIAKRQTRTDEIEQKIQAMYAKSMSQRDIEDTVREIYGADVSQGMISRITDKILPEVNEWQNRPLDFQRFPSAPQYAAFLGLVPGEHSSSDSCNRLPITKAGNSHLRRLLVEAANSYSRVRVGRKSAGLKQRQQGNPPEVIAYADKASDRLRRKYVRISTRSKGNIAKTAVARELACFVWGMMNNRLS